MIEHIWQPETGIAEIEGDWHALRASEVEGIGVVWGAQRERLKGTPQLTEFTERLSREWAIETGIIENLYDIDRGTTQTLIEHGFRTELLSQRSMNRSRDLVVQFLRDQKDALDGVFDFVAQGRELSTSYIKELHAALLRSQTHTDAIDPAGHSIQVPLLRGDWKVQPNSPTRDGEIYAYCPPEQVVPEMDRLVDGHLAHRRDGVSADIQAAWLHHRFTQIHPFQDGNGRVARALASLVLVQAGLFPLVVTRDDKVVYLDALEAADAGNLKPLIGMIAKLQREQFRKATAISEQILGTGTDVQQMLAGLNRVAEQVGNPLTPVAENVREHAATLQSGTISSLSRIEPNILNALQRVTPLAGVSIHRSDSNTGDRFLSQIAENAKNRYGYIPDISSYRTWISLDMVWRRRARLVFTFHGIGLPGLSFNAALCCAPFFEFHDLDENPLARETPIPVADELFTFFDTETHQEVLTRFQEWRERVLVTALRERTANLSARTAKEPSPCQPSPRKSAGPSPSSASTGRSA